MRLKTKSLIWLLIALALHACIFLVLENKIVYEKPSSDTATVEFLAVKIPKPPSPPPSPAEQVHLNSFTPPSIPIPTIPIQTSSTTTSFSLAPSSVSGIQNSLDNAIRTLPTPPPQEAAGESPQTEESSSEKPLDISDFLSGSATDDGFTMPYRLFVPRHLDTNKTYPLVLFLHGAGECGTDNQLQLKYKSTMIFAEPKNQAKYPCYELAPQCPPGHPSWASYDDPEPTQVLKTTIYILDKLIRENPQIDPHRVYVTGLSSGGSGTTDALRLFPDRFAAAVPISTGWCSAYFKTFCSFPMWFMFNQFDRPGVEIRSNEMLSIIRNNNYPCYATVFETAGHNAWDHAYAEPDLIPWLFQFRSGCAPLNSPTDLKCDHTTETGVNLEWNAPLNTDENDIIAYKVYRDRTFIKLIPRQQYIFPPLKTYHDSDLNPGESYTYEVAAVNRSNMESQNRASLTVQMAACQNSLQVTNSECLDAGLYLITFDKRIAQSESITPAMFHSDKLSVLGAEVWSDERTVLLETIPINNTEGEPVSISGLAPLANRYLTSQNLIVSLKPQQVKSGVEREYWLNQPGDSVDQIDLSQIPNEHTVVSTLEEPRDWWRDYGVRLRGFIRAPKTSMYTFYASTNQTCKVWISSSIRETDKQLIIDLNSPTTEGVFDGNDLQHSTAIQLQEGRYYYFEVLHKKGGGNGERREIRWPKVKPDFLSIKWKIDDGPVTNIESGNLIPWPLKNKDPGQNFIFQSLSNN